MGLNTSSLYRRAFGKEETRIIWLGLDAAGKTTILYKLQLGEVVTTIPTIGFNVEHVKFAGKSIVEITAWDVGGRCNLRPLWRHYYKTANCAVFVVDSNDRDRIEEVKDQLHRFINEDEIRDFPLLVFANKQDLPNAMRGVELMEKLGLHSLRNRKWFLQESSALDGSGLYEGLEWLSRALKPGKEQSALVFPKQSKVANKDHEAQDEGCSNADTESTADTEAFDAHA